MHDPDDPCAFAREVIEESEVGIAVSDLLRIVNEAGFDIDEDDLIDGLVDDGGVWWINDQLLIAEQVLTSRRAFSHRLTADEIARDALEHSPDVHLLTLDEVDAFRSNLGPLRQTSLGNREVLAGESGWLREFAAGDLLAIRWTCAGEVTVELSKQPSDGALEIQALRRAMERRRGDDDVADLLSVLVDVCQSEYLAFEQAPPLTELLDRAGLCSEGDQVADSGFDWLALWDARRSRYVDDLGSEHGLDRDSAENLALLRISSLWDDPVSHDVDLVACARALRDPGAVDVFLEGFWGRFPDRIERLRTFAEAVIAIDERCAGAHMVLARLAEADGDPLAHAASVDRALGCDPHFLPAWLDRAWIDADSGDVRSAIRHLERYDDTDDRLGTLDTYAVPGPMTAGRNDSCPCGTELKHKLCCGPFNGYALTQRVCWLYEKAIWFATRPAQREALREVINELIRDSIPPEEGFETFPGSPVFEVLATDQNVLEALLFGRGLIRQFRDERRLLLPPDEAGVLDSWLDARCQLLRVDGFDEYLGALVMADLVTDQSVTAFLPIVTDHLAPGTLLTGYVLDDGSGPALIAWSSIDPLDIGGVREALAAGDPLAVPRVRIARRLTALEV